MKPVQISHNMKPVQIAQSLKPAQIAQNMKPVQIAQSLKPVQIAQLYIPHECKSKIELLKIKQFILFWCCQLKIESILKSILIFAAQLFRGATQRQ